MSILDNPLILLGLSTLFSVIPVIIWFIIFIKKSKSSRKVILSIFLLGCFTGPLMLGIQYFWSAHPRFNLEAFIANNIQEQSIIFLLTYVLFGAMEELLKMFVVKGVDKKTNYITKVNDAIRFSIASALGFSFIENLYYLYQFWPSIGLGELTGMYIFRSIFTTCAHIIFSGVFGYYYGVGKFSIVMNQQKTLTEGNDWLTKTIAKLFKLPLAQSYKQKVVVKGLVIAIGMHATFNFLLHYNNVLGPIAFVIFGFMFMQYLLQRKAGHLVLSQDPSTRRKSTMAKNDQGVVEELLGMWFSEKKYVDVMHVCERLLERDPDNRVVKLFKAKAIDKMDDKDVYKKILNTVVKSNSDLSDNQKNIIAKYTREKEMFKKVKLMVKEQLIKEGKQWVEPKKVAMPAIPAPTQKEEKTFKIENK
jgi:RsiW-degrading membrane proteinase PrsW (M82 family)